MNVGVRFSLVAAVVLVTLAGCGRGFFQGSRAPWRHEAEAQCMSSGAVKIGAGDVRIEPIEGPGVCGMDFPLKVSMLGEPPALAFGDDARPPAAIPQDSSMPRWPVRQQYYSPQPVQSAPLARAAAHEQLRWVTGPPPASAPQGEPADGAPMSITPQRDSYAPVPAQAPRAVSRPWVSPDDAPAMPQADAMPGPDDIPPDTILPGGHRPEPAAPRTQRAYNAPDYQPPVQRIPPALGPMRGPYSPASIPQATLQPAAKLACPIVSALDRWVSGGVQPAALHWFRSPVVEIRQIGSYSCRSMVGAGTSHISEHAFGNALDIAGFTLADGRTITVKDGWHGSPEEQGFLHDVQLYACETFTTVLAPGYNPEHYNHIHVDLMKRRPGYRPCRPTAIRGEIVAARARAHYASRGPAYTGSIGKLGHMLEAIAGADGLADDDSSDNQTTPALEGPRTTGSIPQWLRTPTRHTGGSKQNQSDAY
jgi:hypothetical protein